MHEKNDHRASKKWLEDQFLQMIVKADVDMKSEKSSANALLHETDRTSPLAYAHLEAATSADYPALSTSEKLKLVASELLDNLEASREGDGVVLTYVMHELSQNPHQQLNLQIELDSIERAPWKAETPGTIDTDLLQALDRLPLVDAVIKETMRLHSLTPGPQRRDVPPGGTTVDGYFVPAGAVISSSQRAIHRVEEVFPDPGTWKPERWMLTDSAKELGDRDPSRWWWGFGSGAMSCSGKDFAVIGMPYNNCSSRSCKVVLTIGSDEIDPSNDIRQLHHDYR
jgi:hypothetical protein